MQEKAKAWQEYNAAAVAEMLVEKLPEVAAAVAAPLERIDRIVIVNTGGNGSTGVDRITQGVTDVMAQLPGVAEMLTGIDLPELIRQVPGLKTGPSGNGEDVEDAQEVASGEGVPE